MLDLGIRAFLTVADSPWTALPRDKTPGGSVFDLILSGTRKYDGSEAFQSLATNLLLSFPLFIVGILFFRAKVLLWKLSPSSVSDLRNKLINIVSELGTLPRTPFDNSCVKKPISCSHAYKCSMLGGREFICAAPSRASNSYKTPQEKGWKKKSLTEQREGKHY